MAAASRRNRRCRRFCWNPPLPARPCFADWRFFFNDTATTEIYTLSLHDALPIFHFLVNIFDLCAPRGIRSAGQVTLDVIRSEEHTSELQSPDHLVCRLLLEKKNKTSTRKPQRLC